MSRAAQFPPPTTSQPELRPEHVENDKDEEGASRWRAAEPGRGHGQAKHKTQNFLVTVLVDTRARWCPAATLRPGCEEATAPCTPYLQGSPHWWTSVECKPGFRLSTGQCAQAEGTNRCESLSIFSHFSSAACVVVQGKTPKYLEQIPISRCQWWMDGLGQAAGRAGNASCCAWCHCEARGRGIGKTAGGAPVVIFFHLPPPPPEGQ